MSFNGFILFSMVLSGYLAQFLYTCGYKRVDYIVTCPKAIDKMVYTLYCFLQLLACLRVLIRRCVYDNVNKDEIQKLFPAEVLPELQRLLTLLLQKFQREWREDISKDQVTVLAFTR